MSTKQSVKPQGANAFTARDFELLAAVFECTKGPIEVDYAKFADKIGLKNAASGKASWHALKKKLEKQAGSGGAAKAGPTGSEEKAPAKGSKKRKGADDADDEDETAPASKATKKGRKGSAAAAKKEEVVEEEIIKDESEDDLIE